MLVSLLPLAAILPRSFALVASSSALSSRVFDFARSLSLAPCTRAFAASGAWPTHSSHPCSLLRAKRAKAAHAPRPQSSHILHRRARRTMDFRASNAYTGPVPGYVFTTRNGRTGYYEDPQ